MAKKKHTNRRLIQNDFIKILNTKIDKKQIIIDLVIEAKITASVTSSAESGLPIKSTIFPIIFPDSIEDDECAKDC